MIHASNERRTGEKFGFPVVIRDGVILVGALQTSLWSNGEYLAKVGSVYVFEQDENTDQWVKVKKLMPSDPVGHDMFGKMVDIHNGTIIIGASLQENYENDFRVGAAYVFTKDETGEWVERQKLEASNRRNGAQFGEAVAISGDYIFIGASGHAVYAASGNTSQTGAAYVFKKDTNGSWQETQYLFLDDVSVFDEKFGQSVSASR
ncbi:FG-GAP repeat protein [Lacinutrix neustonica]|uniref:FG-GAP repeat protein n=1 Tax=Lacinutrix neustonica TaxID=2980107 RepID=A0A9E8SEH6_9FLAO|nr:FG-GAP repeat protein [Lacinutrix neustonica]WAC02717.1 FG-GAP repeat protein [Lacinutrix neustonica]